MNTEKKKKKEMLGKILKILKFSRQRFVFLK
jgi:hypothetical protein